MKWKMLSTLALALVITGVAYAQDGVSTDEAGTIWRTHTAPDLATFEYPLETYSVRRVNFSTLDDRSSQVLFPGIITIDPNDELLYTEGHGTVYRVSMYSVANETQQTADDLDGLLGTLPYNQYDPETLDGHELEHVEVGGLPAVQVSQLPVGQYGQYADIIAVSEQQIFEIIVEPVAETGGEANADAPVIDAILDSLEFNVAS